jgi:hypothetical protein
MTTVQVDILNPKAGKLLEDLAELKLISIRTVPNDGFLKLVNKFRAKAKTNPPSLAEITKDFSALDAVIANNTVTLIFSQELVDEIAVSKIRLSLPW